MLLMFNLVVPTFVRVASFAGLVVPMITVPKVRLVGDNFATGLEIAICELVPLLCVIGNLAFGVPVRQGLKVKPRLLKGRSIRGAVVVGSCITGL